MAQAVLRFHHLGLLVGDLGAASARFGHWGYEQGPIVVDAHQGVRLQLCRPSAGDTVIELIEPLPDNVALNRLLSRRREHAYHVCYEADSIPVGMNALRMGAEDRVVEVSAAAPAPLFGGREVAFFHVPSVGLIEILATSSSGDPTRGTPPSTEFVRA